MIFKVFDSVIFGHTRGQDGEEDTYVVPAGQGSFSFQQGLLLRAKETYSKKSVGNKYEIISKWLLTGLAVVISRTNWNILSKNRTLSMTPGYPADEEDKTRKPYAQPRPNSLLPATWQTQVSWMSHASYVQATEAFNTARMRQENRSLTLAQPRGRARNNVVPPVLLKASASSSAEP